MARNEMERFEYRVVPAPRKGRKARGAKTSEARFAAALMEIMNEMGADGWEYQRADTLPCDQRSGLTGKTTVYHNMLVFRRVIPAPRQGAAKAEIPSGPAIRKSPAARAESNAESRPERETGGKEEKTAPRRLGPAFAKDAGKENGEGESPRLGPAQEASAPES